LTFLINLFKVGTHLRARRKIIICIVANRGEQFDPNLGLQYLRARYYAPSLGRFVSVDPFAGMIEEPMSRHRYLYGYDNPIGNLDPSGMFTMEDVTAFNTINNILLGLGTISLGQRVAGLILGGGDIEWSGPVIGGTANFAPNYVAGELTAILTSEENGYGPNGLGRLKGVWVILTAGSGISPLSVSGTVGTLDMRSPRPVGVSLGALSGGFLAGSGDYVSGFGIGGLAITMGLGYGVGVDISLGIDLGITVLTGLSIPVYRQWLPPTP